MTGAFAMCCRRSAAFFIPLPVIPVQYERKLLIGNVE
jgi:hypothetical protein